MSTVPPNDFQCLSEVALVGPQAEYEFSTVSNLLLRHASEAADSFGRQWVPSSAHFVYYGVPQAVMFNWVTHWYIQTYS